MYKHTVKSKLAQTRNAAGTTATPPTPLASGKQGHVGAGKKFFSHIRHKIEDNLTPKITSRLYYKGSKHTRSLSALSILDSGSVGGKYTCKAVATEAPAPTASIMSSSSNTVASYTDSDEESHYSLSLSLTQQSLEDEIFAELEKVAHDESKLQAVLQSFDQILNDYPPPEESESIEQVWAVAVQPPAKFSDRQVLAKSHSTLSQRSSRQAVYQTPELANSMLQLNRGNRYGSLLELSQLRGSRIPISKHSSLRKRSESLRIEQTTTKASKQCTRSMLMLNCKEQVQAKSTKSFRNANVQSDELLVKCLAKGHEILRKVENLNTGRGQQRNRTSRVSKEYSKRKQVQYANEEKLKQLKLESCKIIPPKLGETSDKHYELLVKVVQQQQATKTKPAITQKLAPDDLDSDDSGHISNAVLSASTSASTGSFCESDAEAETEVAAPPAGKSTKIAELLQKFEQKAAESKKPQAVCTATKVAQVQAVRCIQTQVEIYPTYTKEVTMRLH